MAFIIKQTSGKSPHVTTSSIKPAIAALVETSAASSVAGKEESNGVFVLWGD